MKSKEDHNSNNKDLVDEECQSKHHLVHVELQKMIMLHSLQYKALPSYIGLVGYSEKT